MKLIPGFILRRIEHRPNLVKIVDNIGWLFFDKVLRMGVGLLVGVWIARYLGPEQFGLLNFALAFTGLFAAIATLGLQGVVVRDIVQNPQCTKETLGTAALLQLAGGVISFLLIVGTIAYLRPDDPLARTIVAILGAMNLFKASEIAVYWFESQVQSKYTVWVQNSVFLVFAVIKISLILQGASIVAFVLAMLAEQLVVAITLIVVMGRHGLNFTRLGASATRAKTLFKDSWPLVLSALAVSLYMKIDQIMLGQMIGDEAVGIYSAAVRISEVWYFIIPIVLASVFPSLANLHAVGSDTLHKRWAQAYGLMLWLSIAVAFALTLSSNIIVELLFGEEYAKAATVLAILTWAGVNAAIGSVWSKWLLLENKLGIAVYGHLMGAIINIGLNLWLIPKFDIIGAAIATLASYWISAIFVYCLHKPVATFNYVVSGMLIRKKLWN